MSAEFQELDYRQTPLGELSLRRRLDRHHDRVAYEVKLNDEFLMSSLFTVGEQALARAALQHCDKDQIQVVIGGLGLGYTAAATLENDRVIGVEVIEVLQPIIEWHQQGLVPLGQQLVADSRCRFTQADFFSWSRQSSSKSGVSSAAGVDVILLDIDHSPAHLLHPDNHSFYWGDGLPALCKRLTSDGVFAMWSNDRPEQAFLDHLRSMFTTVSSQVENFDNPYSGELASCSIYMGIGPI